jgi:hypothetical protein
MVHSVVNVDWNTVNTATPDYLSKSFAGQLIRYSPNGMAPLFALTSVFNSGNAKSVEHGYFSKTMVFPQTAADGANADIASTSITVESTAHFIVGDMVMNWRTAEVMRVTDITSATVLGVARGYTATGVGVAINNEDALYVIGNAFEQGSYRPVSRLLAVARIMNNTQIFRNTWALPHTLAVIKPIVGGDNVAESRIDCGMFHSSAIENSIIWGQKTASINNNHYMTTMDGIWNTLRTLVPANVDAAGATTDYGELSAMLNPAFDTITDGRSSSERVLYVGGTARVVINDIGRKSGQYQIVDGQTNFGLQFQTFQTARGTFRMIEHPMLNTNPDWAKIAIALDLPSLRLMYLEGRRTMNQEFNLQGVPVDNGIDAVGGTLTTELTMEITNPSANIMITGLTAGVAES